MYLHASIKYLSHCLIWALYLSIYSLLPPCLPPSRAPLPHLLHPLFILSQHSSSWKPSPMLLISLFSYSSATKITSILQSQIRFHFFLKSLLFHSFTHAFVCLCSQHILIERQTLVTQTDLLLSWVCWPLNIKIFLFQFLCPHWFLSAAHYSLYIFIVNIL